MPNRKEYGLIEAIEAVSTELSPDLDIVTVQIVGPAKSPIVRVYIDHPNGVGFDLLCETQKWISEILDEVDPFPGAYTLEVSSPGPNRALRKPKHFIDAINKNAKLITKEPVEGRSTFTGKLIFADDENVNIEIDEGKEGDKPRFVIPLKKISKANLKE